MVAGNNVRLAVLVGLLLGLVGLGIWFGSLPPAPEAGAYPDEAALADDYDGHVGERVVVDGRVVDVDPVTIHVEYGDEAMRLRILDLDADVSTDERLRVYGVVGPGDQIRAISAFAVPSWGMPYAVVTSSFAGLWVLTRLLQYWRLDDWMFSKRDGPIPVLAEEPVGSEAGGDEDG